MLTSVKSSEASPIFGPSYFRTLGSVDFLSQLQARNFLTQWYAFSSSIPRFLSLCAWRAESEKERENILKNLFSEMGMDGKGASHVELLEDLILQATGLKPDLKQASATTQLFLNGLERTVMHSSSAYNSGALQALEHVAYDILNVLKEILRKSNCASLQLHPYIVIHEEIEMEHIQNTHHNIALHRNLTEVSAGFEDVMRQWSHFWEGAYSTFENRSGGHKE